MVIGEFISEDLEELLVRSQQLEKRYEYFCRQRNKIFETLFMTATTTETYFLKIILTNNGNTGEITAH
jgi:hypothetical protein